MRGNTHLGRIFRDARKSLGITQARLGKQAGIGLSAVQAVEQGRGRMTSLIAITKALGLELRGRQLKAGPVGPALFLARKRRRISRRQLAMALSVSVDGLVAVETGGGLVSTLQAYADAVAAGLYLARPGDIKKFSTNQGNSSGNNEWQTPKALAHTLSSAIGGFDLDPCSPTTDRRKARVKAKVLLTAEDDGLSVQWRGRVFVNPPYSRGLSGWVQKCYEESQRGCVVIALLPARPDPGWFHNYIAGKADVFMLRGRLKFGDSTSSAPFPSMAVCWNGEPELINRLSAALSDAWHVPHRSKPSDSLSRKMHDIAAE